MHHLPRFISSLLSMHGSTGVAGADAAVTGIIAFLLLAFVAVLAIVVIILVSLWIVYKKAGRSGWAAIIPFYNYTVMLEMVKKPLWWILLIFFVPVVNIVFSIIVLRRLAESFGKGGWFTAGLVLLPFIFFPILAFGSSTYNADSYGEPAPMTEAVKWALMAAVLYMLMKAFFLSTLLAGMNGGTSHPLQKIAGDDNYATDGVTVYSSDVEVKDADPDTFTDLGNGYGADYESVYYYGDKVLNAEAKSFKELNYGYATDAHAVYYAGEIIKGAEPTSFAVFDDSEYETADGKFDAKDAAHTYKFGVLVK